MTEEPNGLLKYPLLGLKILIRRPKIIPVLSKISAAFYLTTLAYLSVITFLQYRNIEGDIYKFANNFEGSTAYIQLTGKLIFIITHKNKIIELLDEVKLFWSIKTCEGPIRKDLENIISRTRFLLKVFFVCMVATEVLIAMAPIFIKDVALGAWTMQDQQFLFGLTLLLQETIIFFMFTMFTVIIDCMFLVLFVYVIVQFKILNYCLKNLRVSIIENELENKSYSDSLNRCIQHHQFLLRYARKLRDTIAPVMLIEYATTAILFCSEMYIFMESKNLEESIRRSVSFCAVLFQLAFYCVPADYVTEEAIEVSRAISDSDWASEYLPDSRKAIPFVIQQAQQPIIFTAGGLIDMNSKTLITVVKVSWSVCTLLQRMKIINQEELQDCC